MFSRCSRSVEDGEPWSSAASFMPYFLPIRSVLVRWTDFGENANTACKGRGEGVRADRLNAAHLRPRRTHAGNWRPLSTPPVRVSAGKQVVWSNPLMYGGPHEPKIKLTKQMIVSKHTHTQNNIYIYLDLLVYLFTVKLILYLFVFQLDFTFYLLIYASLYSYDYFLKIFFCFLHFFY